MRVLVVDDDESISEFVRLALQDNGHEVQRALNGAEALERVREVPPDLILLDLRMPIMNGWEFSQAYRARPGAHAPIVVLSAARDAAESAAQVDAAAYLAKPFDLRSLLDVVAHFTPPAAS